MQIRDATEDDLAVIAKLSAQLFAEDAGTRDPHTDVTWPQHYGQLYFATALGSDSTRIFVADEHGPRGYLLGRRRPTDALRPGVHVVELESMCVELGQRSRGVGSHLVEAFIRWAEQRGADVLSVTAYADNSRAIQFYTRFGFASHKITLERPAHRARRAAGARHD